MKPNFLAMTKTQLRAYLVSHPNDQDVFYAFVDRFTAQASETFAMPRSQSEVEAVATLIREKVDQTKVNQ